VPKPKNFLGGKKLQKEIDGLEQSSADILVLAGGPRCHADSSNFFYWPDWLGDMACAPWNGRSKKTRTERKLGGKMLPLIISYSATFCLGGIIGSVLLNAAIVHRLADPKCALEMLIVLLKKDRDPPFSAWIWVLEMQSLRMNHPAKAAAVLASFSLAMRVCDRVDDEEA
jgi:hypothetical protein